MHASFEQLIALRDGQPLAADAAEHARRCAECKQALEHLRHWRQQLRGLSGFTAPEGAWQHIAARLDQPERARRSRWLPAAGIGLVASLVAAVALVSWYVPASRPVATRDSVSSAPRLAELQSQSRYLETAVRTMNTDSGHQVVSAGSAATVAALEDRIALVDYAINQTTAQPQATQELTQLWQQRVELLQSLAAVRYAQVTTAAWGS